LIGSGWLESAPFAATKAAYETGWHESPTPRSNEHELIEEQKPMKRLIAVTACTLIGLTGAAIAGGGYGKDKSSQSATQRMDIVDTAVAAGQFKTLAAALQAAGLVDALKGEGPFTVFAPTDAAFAKLPAGTLENLLKPENKATLTKILTFHVIPGEVKAEQVVKMTESSATLAGQTFRIVQKDGKVMIGNDKAMATVVKTDIPATNGVIHVIDTVILPN